jgi:hypothetical protein
VVSCCGPRRGTYVENYQGRYDNLEKVSAVVDLASGPRELQGYSEQYSV